MVSVNEFVGIPLIHIDNFHHLFVVGMCVNHLQYSAITSLTIQNSTFHWVLIDKLKQTNSKYLVIFSLLFSFNSFWIHIHTQWQLWKLIHSISIKKTTFSFSHFANSTNKILFFKPNKMFINFHACDSSSYYSFVVVVVFFFYSSSAFCV